MPAKVSGPTTKAEIKKLLGPKTAEKFLKGEKLPVTRQHIAQCLGVSLATLYRMIARTGPYAGL
jgi:hypothetical protein